MCGYFGLHLKAVGFKISQITGAKRFIIRICTCMSQAIDQSSAQICDSLQQTILQQASYEQMLPTPTGIPTDAKQET